VRRTHAARTELDLIDTDDEGQADYSGDLLSDFGFAAFSHSAPERMADEVCVQIHLLNLSFVLAVGKRAGTNTELVTGICTNQLIGLAAVAAERIDRALGLPGGIDSAMRVLELHPLFNPTAYVTAEFAPCAVHVRRSPAHEDGAHGSRWSVPPKSGRCRRWSRRSNHISTYRSSAPRMTGPLAWSKPTRRQTNFRRCRSRRSAAGRRSYSSPRRSLPLTVV
jgi:hypothetical protein